MTNPILVGIVAGLAACVLQAAILQPSPLTALLFYLSPLPIFMAGLGWGVPAAAIAAATGSALLLSLAGMATSVTFLASAGATPTALVWLALKNRPASGVSEEGEAESQGLQWYPEGRIVLWVAVIAACLTSAAILLMARDIETFRAQATALFNQMMAPRIESLPDAEKQDFQEVVKLMVTALPLIATSVWIAISFINFRLACAILSGLKMGLRPLASFGAMRFPRKAALFLPLALASCFLSGTIGFIGSLFAAAAFTAFAVLGIAVAHGLIERTQMRGPLMAALYVSLVFVGGVLLLPFAALGLLDMALSLRSRGAPPPLNPT